MIKPLGHNNAEARNNVLTKLNEIFYIGLTIKYWSISSGSYISTNVLRIERNYSDVPFNPPSNFILVGSNYTIRFTSVTGNERGYLLLNICQE